MIDTGFQLTVRQKRIRDGLMVMDENIATVYEGAYRVLVDPTNPDRYAQSANSLREVTSLLSRVKGLPREKIEEKVEGDGEGNGARMIGKLRRRFSLEEGNVLPVVQADVGALLRTWNSIHAFLCAVAHHGKWIGKDLPEEMYRAKINELEEILDYFVSPPSLTLVEIDKFLLLDHPTEKDGQELLKALVPSHVYVEYFFTRLMVDNWLSPLRKLGVFLRPQNSISSDVTILFPVWWPSIYLKKMAGAHPDLVVQIIQEMEETDNIRVHADLIEAALNMDAAKAIEIIPLVKKWVRSRYPSLVLMRARELCKKLVEEGENKPALELLKSILTLDMGKDEKNLGVSGDNQFIDWEIGQMAEEVIPSIIARCPSETLALLCDILEERLKRDHDEFSQGYSHVWRPSIEEHEQNSSRDDINNILISVIRDGLLSIGKDNPTILEESVKQLDAYAAPIFKRLKIYTINQHSDLLADELNTAITDVSLLESLDYWHEMFHLLRNHFARLSEEARQNYFGIVRRGLPEETISKRCARLQEGEMAEKRAEEIQALYRMRLLTPIREQIPQELSEMLAKIEANGGPLEHPDFLSGYISTSWGHDKLEGAEDPMLLERDEIISIFNGSVEKSLPFGYDIEHALEKAMAADIEKFIGPPLDLYTVPISFIVHMQQGIIDASKQGIPVDWPRVLALTDALVSHDWESSHPQQQPFYTTDSVYSVCQGTISHFIETNKKAVQKEIVWKIIRKLLEKCVFSRADEQPSWKEEDDLIIHALNDNDGKATNLLIQFLLWSNNIAGEKGRQMETNAREMLEKILIGTLENPSITRTVIGLRYINLYAHFTDWTKANLDRLFPDVTSHRKSWKMTWEGYIVATKLCRDLYTDLRPQYMTAIRKIDSFSEEARDRTIEHIISAYLSGLEELDGSLLKRLSEGTRSEVRGFILRTMGYYLNSALKTLDATEAMEVAIRCRNYWDWRLKELDPSGEGKKPAIADELGKATELFISVPSLENNDFTRLKKTVEFTGGRIDRPQEIIEKLRENSNMDQMATLDVLSYIIRTEHTEWEWELLRKDLLSLLETLYASKNYEIRNRVKILAEICVTQGFFEFEKFTAV